jgi:dihydrofolate reductase
MCEALAELVKDGWKNATLGEYRGNGKNIWLVSGGELVGQFYDAKLLDELIVQVGSVTLDSGKPLLPRFIAFPPLPLLSARATGLGFAE